MVNQTDSPDGKPHKDPDRPSPAFVETDPGMRPVPATVPDGPQEIKPSSPGTYPAPGEPS